MINTGCVAASVDFARPIRNSGGIIRMDTAASEVLGFNSCPSCGKYTEVRAGGDCNVDNDQGGERFNTGWDDVLSS